MLIRDDSADSSVHYFQGGRSECAACDTGLYGCLLRQLRVTTKRAAGAPRFPPSDPARVEILRSEPQRAYDRLGYIVIDASTDPPPSIEKVVAKVRSEAGKLGADAVVVVYDRDQQSQSTRRHSVG